MADKRRHTGDYILLIVLTAMVAVLLSYMMKRYHLNNEVLFSVERNITNNPMMGYAPYAEDIEKCDKSSLVFLKLKWSDWEPEKGQYDTGFLESQFHLSRWRAAGKHAVLRFVCDDPGQEEHADIPHWLLEETNDGTFYSNQYGSGYCPNYENAYFRARHAMAITALADYFNQDDFLAYVELGSLGYWGEWHARDDSGESRMPSSEICWDYILPYSDRFQDVRFLMRRSYAQAVEMNAGLYHDMLGHGEETERWLDWTVSGGMQDTQGQSLQIVPYDAFWETAPVGGELTSSTPLEEMMEQGLSELLNQLEKCHLTFLGPHSPDPEAYASAYDAIARRLGYQYYVSRLRTAFSFAEDALSLELDWENAGTAPLYWDWPVMIMIFDVQNNPIYWETLDLKLSQLPPGEKITTITNVPYLDILHEGFSIGISITSYDGNDHVQLAMDTEPMEQYQIIYSFNEG